MSSTCSMNGRKERRRYVLALGPSGQILGSDVVLLTRTVQVYARPTSIKLESME
jgi:hypothetical protein